MSEASARRFACTACGRCCDRGPEMELGESLALADLFLMSMILKAHSLPRNERGEAGRRWWRGLETPLGPGPALNEHRRSLEPFAALRQVDRGRDRQLFLTLSAIVEDEQDGRCPALIEGRCGVYERRPQTCRTVPLHYSRPVSTLAAYLDRFVATPGYECETDAAPVVLRGGEILADEVREARAAALRVAEGDRDWKAALVASMGDGASARAAGLPTVDDVISNSDKGYASMVPIHVAWRAALGAGLMTREVFSDLCRRQSAAAEDGMARRPHRRDALAERLRDVRAALAAA